MPRVPAGGMPPAELLNLQLRAFELGDDDFAGDGCAVDGRRADHRTAAGVGEQHLIERQRLTGLGVVTEIDDHQVAFCTLY